MTVIEKLPLLSAVSVPKTISPFKSVTVELASAVPVIVGVESSESDVFVKEVGAFGAVVSIVMVMDDDFDEIFSAESVEVAVIE